MPKFNISGQVKFDVDFEIEADSEIAAIAKAESMMNDMYHLDSYGTYHDPKQEKYNDIDAIEIED